MNTDTHNVKKIIVREVDFGHFKTVKVKIIAAVPRWCDSEFKFKEELVEHNHTFFTHELDLEVEFMQETEEE